MQQKQFTTVVTAIGVDFSPEGDKDMFSDLRKGDLLRSHNQRINDLLAQEWRVINSGVTGLDKGAIFWAFLVKTE